MKKSIFALAFIIFSSVSLFAQNETLRGDEAIEQLRKTGQYNSLADAVKDARKKNTQPEEPPIEDAVGYNTKLFAPVGGVNDDFGAGISISGDTAIIGESEDTVGGNNGQGSAFIFIKTGTTWTQQAQIFASDGAIGDLFGISVSIDGDTAIVGTVFGDVGGNADQGAAYIFTRSGTVWTQQAKLAASDGAASDRFGHSVSINGDTAIVGAIFGNVGANPDAGAAYVFVRNGTMWTQQAKLAASDGMASDNLGWSVSNFGDTAVAGAPNVDINGNFTQGAVYVFSRSGGVWTQDAKLLASNGSQSNFFGNSISMDGDTFIVGAVSFSVGANTSQGSAYIFTRSGSTWTEQAQLLASDGEFNDRFGESVSISGNTVVIGAVLDDIGANPSQGSAYVFTRSGTVWTQQQKLTAFDGITSDNFGSEVAIDGINIMVAARSDDVGAVVNAGSVYVFRFLNTGWTQEAQKIASDGAAGDLFGWSVAINGDTAIVGAYNNTVGANSAQGSVYVFVRNGTVWTQQAQLIASDGDSFDRFGNSVSIYGDLAIVGAEDDDVGANTNQGSAYIFIRNGTTWTQQAKLLASDGEASDNFGFSVSISGISVIVGALSDDVGGNLNQGSAYVFTANAGVWTEQAQLNAADGMAGDQFGFSVSMSGNTVIVGASSDDVGANADQGSAYVFVRTGSVWTPQAQLNGIGGTASDQFGFSLAIDGDTAVIGALGNDVGANADQGSAYIFVRNGSVWTQQAELIGSNGAANDLFGWSVSLDGDTAIIGAPFDDVGANASQGSVYIFGRNSGVWTQQSQLTDMNGLANDNFGRGVAISGDKSIVGTPFSDVSVNNPLTPQLAEQGAVFIYINNLVPNAAGVSVGGRILSADGNGVRNATVSATLANGEVITTRSTTFGYYNFDDLEAGQTIVISVNSKRFSFTPQVVTLSDNIEELNFWAQ